MATILSKFSYDGNSAQLAVDGGARPPHFTILLNEKSENNRILTPSEIKTDLLY